METIRKFLACVLLGLFLMQESVQGQKCNALIGPAGGLHCVCIDRYHDCQWATCLSRSYIELKSRRRHTCETSWALFCYYQCQLEEYSLGSGAVHDKCKCQDGDPPPTPAPAQDNSEVDESCSSPDGTSCKWYSECLEKKFNCEETSNGYAITYAHKFCNLYNQRIAYFTPQGQHWINAVRKCLQAALVPLMRPWESPSCAEIKARAFASHSPCYLDPAPGAPSICDLNCHDWAQVVWTIKSGFIQTFVESLKGVVEVMLGCGKNLDLMGSDCPSVILKLGLVYTALRGKRDTNDQSFRDSLAGDITDQLAKRLNWDSKAMEWFAFASNVTESSPNPDQIEINIMMGDKVALKIDQFTSNVSPKFNLQNVVSDFSDALRGGYLYDLEVKGGSAAVSTLDACQDMQCKTFDQAKAGPKALKRRSLAVPMSPETFLVWLCTVFSAYFGRHCF